uniref:UDP-galactose/UDP-glucose transporter 3 n=1 Tax=Zea mays TaxID=4577 RepID=A0A804PX48_MAIZE
MIKLWSSGSGSSSDGRAPLSKYWGVSVTNTIGPTMGIEALKYINYPAQVLAKSSKMIPVMLMGTLLYGVKYTLPEYFCTFLVAGDKLQETKTVKKLANPNAPLGYTLCFLNLAFDGYTNSTQDLIKSRYPKTNPWDIMLGMNLWGTIYNAVVMFVAPLLFSNWPYADGFEALRFCQENPEVAWDIFLFCLCGAVGQNYIFLTISRFGALTNTTITTTVFLFYCPESNLL